MLTGHKLALTLAFTVLLALAVGVSCQGFFPPNTITALSIQPPTPEIEVGANFSQTLQAWASYDDGSRAQITNGVDWSSSDDTVLVIGTTSGLATGVGSGGSATVTAAAQGLSTTATATVFLGNITGYAVCQPTFGSTTCSSGSTPLVWDATNNSSTESILTFVAQGTANGTTLDLTTASTWTVESSISSSITCTGGASPESCTVPQNTGDGTYTITVTYGTGSSTVTAVISVVVTG